jgi:hypothetical protein
MELVPDMLIDGFYKKHTISHPFTHQNHTSDKNKFRVLENHLVHAD